MAGRIPQEFIDQLLERVDIVDVIGAAVRLKKKGKDHLGLCPFHNEKTPSFSVSSQKQFYYCFGCGASGNALKFLLENNRMGFIDAIDMLAAKAGMEVPRGVTADPGQNYQPLYDLLSQASLWFANQLKTDRPAQDYLEQSRGLSAAVMRTFNIGYAPLGWDNLLRHLSVDASIQTIIAAGLVVEKSPERRYDRFRQRVIFPIRDIRGRTIAFGGRVLLSDDQPKYLNSPETSVFHKGHHLYGLYETGATRLLESLLCVEGYMDVITLTQAGIAGVVASMGTTVTDMQLNLAFRQVKEIVFCFDGDAAGKRAAWRTLERVLPALDDSRQAKFMFLPQDEDPDSFVHNQGVEAFRQAMTEATNMSDFLLAGLQEGIDTSSMDGLARLANRAAPLIRTIKGPLLRDLLEQKMHALTTYGISQAAQPARRRTAFGATSRAPLAIGGIVRQVLHNLLLAPQAARDIPEEELPRLRYIEDTDAVLLDRVLRVLKHHPTDNSAVLIAQFSGEPVHETLVQLCKSDVVLPAEGRVAQLIESWRRLCERADRDEASRKIAELEARGHAADLEPCDFEKIGKLVEAQKRRRAHNIQPIEHQSEPRDGR